MILESVSQTVAGPGEIEEEAAGATLGQKVRIRIRYHMMRR